MKPKSTKKEKTLIFVVVTGLIIFTLAAHFFNPYSPQKDWTRLNYTFNSQSLIFHYDFLRKVPDYALQYYDPKLNTQDIAYFDIRKANIPLFSMISLSDYQNTDFIPVPLIELFDTEWEYDSFFCISCPQYKTFKLKAWNHLNLMISELYHQGILAVTLKGPVFLGNPTTHQREISSIGRVLVPTHFFCIIYSKDKQVLGYPLYKAYLIPHTKDVSHFDLNQCQIDLKELENLIGRPLPESIPLRGGRSPGL